MRLVTLTKLTIHTPQGDQTKFFADDFDALAYKKMSRIQHSVSLTSCNAILSENSYCLAVQMIGHSSNANFKSKNTVYYATVSNTVIELHNVATTLLTEAVYVYLSEDNQLYCLQDRITVETTPVELQRAKADYNQTIATAQAQHQQPTLHQFWRQPQQASPAATLRQAGWWPIPTPQPTPAANDPMEVEKTNGYDYWGIGK